jgi:hypothetical protein
LREHVDPICQSLWSQLGVGVEQQHVGSAASRDTEVLRSTESNVLRECDHLIRQRASNLERIIL